MTATQRRAAWLTALAFGMAANAAHGVIVLPPVQVGTLSSAVLDSVLVTPNELSGIVGSHSLANTLWGHNDAGDSARFFAISTQGTVLGQFPLAGAVAVDWEDIAIGPAPGNGHYLYLGDIGDNDSVRPQISVYRVDEPQSATGVTIDASHYAQALLQYPDGARNAESLMVDPISGELFIVTKSAVARVYSAPANVFDHPGQTTSLTALGDLNVPLNMASGADISSDGAHILVRDRSTTAYLFERGVGQSVWDALQGPAVAITLAAETQGEAIGWAADGLGFYTTSEWRTVGPRPIYYYGFVVPEPASGHLFLIAVLALSGGHLAGRRRARQQNAKIPGRPVMRP